MDISGSTSVKILWQVAVLQVCLIGKVPLLRPVVRIECYRADYSAARNFAIGGRILSETADNVRPFVERTSSLSTKTSKPLLSNSLVASRSS